MKSAFTALNNPLKLMRSPGRVHTNVAALAQEIATARTVFEAIIQNHGCSVTDCASN